MNISRARRKAQKGAIMVLAAGAMVMTVGVIAMAVDIGRIMVVRNELQNAADAAALAGAAKLSNFATPAWSAACAAATAAIPFNKSETQAFATGVVKAGVWSIDPGQSSDMTTADCAGARTVVTPFNGLVPAVSVQLTRDSGQNQGPFLTFFARIFGLDSLAMTATAVAGISYPSNVPGASLAPFAISNCMLASIPTTGYSDSIKIFSAQDNPDSCEKGQWTTLNFSPSNVATVRDIMMGDKVPTGMDLTSSSTWYPLDMNGGQDAALYGDASTYLVGKTMIVPVVDGSLLGKGSAADQPILTFMAFEVTDAYQTSNQSGGGAGSYLEGRFTRTLPGSTPTTESSPYLGLVTSPKLLGGAI